MTHQAAINIAHDERRPFCFRAEWFVIPYYIPTQYQRDQVEAREFWAGLEDSFRKIDEEYQGESGGK